MSMQRIVKTWDGHTINDGSNYRAAIVNTHALPAANPVFLEQMQADAVDAGTFSVDVGNIALFLRVLDRSNFETLTSQLKNWFKRGTRANLVVTFAGDADFLKNCRVVNLVRDQDHDDVWVAQLQTGATAWRAVSAETYEWAVTGTGSTHTETLPATDDETLLSMTFEASGLPTVGYLYQKLYRLTPPNGVTYGVRPWLVSMDTAALVADNSNKCQINNGAGITAGDTTIPYDTVTGTLPSAGMGYCGSEQIAWTGKTGTTSGNLTGCTRGLHGTTAATHADNAEIKLSHMQADCDDLRVYLGDTETRRWIVSPNNASTKVWFNVDLKTGFSLTLGTAIAISGDITEVQLTVDATHQSYITVMPDEGIIYHGTEWISYRGRDVAKCQLLNPTRGILSTTLQAHSVGDSMVFIPTAIKIVYGNSAVGDPADADIDYDDTKPVFDLSSSTNAEWAYTASSVFYDPLFPNRPGAWMQSVERVGDISSPYDYTEEGTTTPAMGMKLVAFQRAGVWQAEYGTISWKFFSAGGIEEISATGQTYRNDATFPATAALQYEALVGYSVRVGRRTRTVYSMQWLNLWNETSPASVSTWTDWTHNTVSVPDTTVWVRFALGGSMPALANVQADLEALTVTVVFTTSNVPSGSLLSETSNYPLSVTLFNDTTGESIDLDFPMRLSVPLIIDGEAFTVRYEGVNSHDAMVLDDESRDCFMRLVAGGNDLRITATDAGTLGVDLSYYRRRL